MLPQAESLIRKHHVSCKHPYNGCLSCVALPEAAIVGRPQNIANGDDVLEFDRDSDDGA